MIASPERKENQKQIIKKGKPKTDYKERKTKNRSKSKKIQIIHISLRTACT